MTMHLPATRADLVVHPAAVFGELVCVFFVLVSASVRGFKLELDVAVNLF